MKCVIMQPTFFPWAGYFYLASQADVFVFLDDVQLEKQSWQTRNCILLNGKAAWISVPLIHMGSEQKICEVEVFDQSLWRIKLLRKLAQTYARHPFCDVMLKGANLLGGMSKIICFKSSNCISFVIYILLFSSIVSSSGKTG